ncbi:MAG: carboxypeptidase-like regulatory domain-containing protein [Bifidobacteriaceae bacterium]|jgi:type II secretory pathway pseudopilin PulG|nr:carboxypeptidase-like regulatory domain-containing protein [Bifidobacteriaceae bacterium]
MGPKPVRAKRCPTGGPRPQTTGASLVEVVVAIAVMAVFTLAAAAVVATTSATSRDNRARLGASGLAQRELEFASQAIAGGGAQALRAAGLVANPNLSAELASGEAEYAFKIDGQRYRLTRQAELWQARTGSACESETIGGQAVWGTIVTVTVTWEGLGQGAKPHVAAQVFPPMRDETLGLDPGQALLAVKVGGGAGAGAGAARAGVKVEVAGQGAPSFQATTDQTGCALVPVTPPPGALGLYQVKLLGDGSGQWVTPGGDDHPVQEVAGVAPGASRRVGFPPYDRAAQLTVNVVGASAAVGSAQIEPASGAQGATTAKTLDAAGRARFDKVFPGTYFVTAGQAAPQTVELAPGAAKTVEVVAG